MEINDSLSVIKELYKPIKYTKKGNIIILETTEGKYVVKNKSDYEVKDLYNYLLSRDFNNFPRLIDSSRSDISLYEYLEDNFTPKEQKALDLIDVVGNLHYKTTYFKNVTQDKFNSIYEDIDNNISFLTDTFNTIFDAYDDEIYCSPSGYLILRNKSLILTNLSFCKNELDNWYDLVKEKTKTRVSVIHNNLNTEHFIKGDRDYLLSWEHSKIDTPIIDLVVFYKNEYLNINFEEVFKKYNYKNPLNLDELKLFFVLISLPFEINLEGSEYEKTKKISSLLDYLNITNNLIRPYYSENEEE